MYLTGGHGVELIKGGSQVEVAPENVMEYVRKYAEYRMHINTSRCLQVIRLPEIRFILLKAFNCCGYQFFCRTKPFKFSSYITMQTRENDSFENKRRD